MTARAITSPAVADIIALFAALEHDDQVSVRRAVLPSTGEISSQKIDLADTLGEASSFVKAIRMCCEGMSNAQGNAINLLAEQIGLRIEKALCVIDDIQEGQ